MNKYKEKEVKKYVIADLSTPTNYVISKRNGNYCLIDNIAASTKFVSKNTANAICIECVKNTGLNLVVIPIMVTYEIIEED
jgi:hypothetical protein